MNLQLQAGMSLAAFLDGGFPFPPSVGWNLRITPLGFPGGAVVGSPPADAGERVRALVREEPTCCGAAGPVSHGC